MEERMRKVKFPSESVVFHRTAKKILKGLGVDVNSCAVIEGLGMLNDAALAFAVAFHKDVIRRCK
jgi:hypothetical protein